MNKKQKLLYLLSVALLVLGLFLRSVFAQTATLSVSLNTLDSNGAIIYGGSAPLTGIAMTATVSGTATGSINYYFYCNAQNDSSTEIIPGYAYSVIGTNSTTVTTPNGICDEIYANIGTYLAKAIVQRGGIAAEERRTVTVSSPVPAVDLKVRPLGTTEWSDWSITIPYNSAAEIRWTFSGASPCTMKGDWSGTKTSPGQESTGNLTVAKTYYYTLECATSVGMLTDTVIVIVEPPTLYGSISASPNSGNEPLSGVVLTGNVTGGTALGTVNYTFYCNRSDTNTNITSGYAYKVDNTNLLSVSAPANVCDTTYSKAGTYTAKVIIERGGVATEARTTITVNPPPPPIVDLNADSTQLEYNTSTTLRWTVTNATSCTPSAGPVNWTSSGSKNVPSGSWPTGNLTGSANYTYALSCTGPGGTRSDSVTISVGAPPSPPRFNLMVSYENGPYLESISVPNNSKVTLRWEYVGDKPDSCEASAFPSTAEAWWNGSKNPGGGWEIIGPLPGGTSLPGERYEFTLTCFNAGGSTKDTVIVTVFPEIPLPIVELEVRPKDGNFSNIITIDYGTDIELRWTVDSLAQTTCEAKDDWSGPKSLTGSQIITQLTSDKKYTLICTNPGGSTSKTVTVIVRFPLAPKVDLQVREAGGTYNTSEITIDYGKSIELKWTVENAAIGTTCEASDGWSGPISPQGGTQVFTNITSYERYNLDCYNSGGRGWDSVAVNVKYPPRPTVKLSAREAGKGSYTTYGLVVDYNSAVEIKYDVTNATSCVASGTGWSGLKLATGGIYTAPPLTNNYYVFILTCYNAAGDEMVDRVDVEVREPKEGAPIIFENPLKQSDMRAILESLGGLIRMIAISLAAIMIIISGIIILTSVDDRERLKKGKNMLKWTLIGLAVALASSFIIGFIEELINV